MRVMQQSQGLPRSNLLDIQATTFICYAQDFTNSAYAMGAHETHQHHRDDHNCRLYYIGPDNGLNAALKICT